MRARFEKHLSVLENDLYTMAELVTVAIEKSVNALKERDIDAAKEVRKDDIIINNKRWEIEDKCINLIATQQPVATDLRELIAILNIVTDMERMGDYADGIAKVVIIQNGEPPVKPLIDIPRMSEIAINMINSAMRAYAERDDKEARIISAQDDSLDELYKQVYRELLSIMIENPKTITRATYLMWAAHNLERIGDRVTNICERIVYLVTGEMIENID